MGTRTMPQINFNQQKKQLHFKVFGTTTATFIGRSKSISKRNSRTKTSSSPWSQTSEAQTFQLYKWSVRLLFVMFSDSKKKTAKAFAAMRACDNKKEQHIRRFYASSLFFTLPYYLCKSGNIDHPFFFVQSKVFIFISWTPEFYKQ